MTQNCRVMKVPAPAKVRLNPVILDHALSVAKLKERDDATVVSIDLQFEIAFPFVGVSVADLGEEIRSRLSNLLLEYTPGRIQEVGK